MFNEYFQKELNSLKQGAVEYSKAHPALAPMLATMLDDTSSDPDVNRLFEGVAFLTGLIKQKVDDEFPEIIHELTRLFWPHYLRILPSATIISFTPQADLQQPATIPAGIYVESVPVEGTSCKFKTCYDVQLHPLKLLDVLYEEPSGMPGFIKLVLELTGIQISDWKPESLRFFLAGNYRDAADLYLTLRNNLKQITIGSSKEEHRCSLSPANLKPVGFSQNHGVIPYPSQSFTGYRVLQEYFLMPDKFLFLDLVGLQSWHTKDSGQIFEICFELDEFASGNLRVNKDSIKLFTTPVVNVFPHPAAPITIDHKRTEYRVRPTGNLSHYQVFSVEKVTGVVRNTTKTIDYKPLHKFTSDDSPVYNEILKHSTSQDRIDLNISVAYPAGSNIPQLESLSLDIMCTNAHLAERLLPGDIKIPTDSAPDFAGFTNLRSPGPGISPELGTNFLWKLLSHLSLNYVSISNSENLKSILQLYVSGKNIKAHKNRIQGIKELETVNTDMFVKGAMIRGREIRIKADSDHFPCKGDLYLFGSVLDVFLGLYASINTFTRLIVEDIITGEEYRWEPRTGQTLLI